MAEIEIPPRREYSRQYYQKNKDKIRARVDECRRRLKIETLTHYGGGKLACVQCGISDLRVLTVDHINGKGSEHRRELGRRGRDYYYWLRDIGFPKGCQTLCFNCQMIKRFERGEFAHV